MWFVMSSTRALEITPKMAGSRLRRSNHAFPQFKARSAVIGLLNVLLHSWGFELWKSNLSWFQYVRVNQLIRFCGTSPKSMEIWSGNLTHVFVLSFCSCLCWLVHGEDNEFLVQWSNRPIALNRRITQPYCWNINQQNFKRFVHGKPSQH